MIENQSIAGRIYDFIHLPATDESTVRELVQNSFRIGLGDLDNLYTLKYHLEKENDVKVDEAVLFINTIIDIYSRSAMYIIDRARTVSDLLSTETTEREKSLRLLKALHQNSGIIDNGVNEAVFKGNNLIVKRKQVIMQEDGSVYFLVTSNKELDRFNSELFEKYSHHYSRVRSNDIKDKLSMMKSDNYFEGKFDEIICVTNLKPDLIEFTVQEQDFCIVNDGGTIFQDFDLEDKGRYYRVWLI